MAEALRPFDAIIVGGGPAGLSAGIYASRAGLSTLIAEMFVPGGQIVSTSSIENYPGIPMTGGYDLGDSLRNHAEEAGCTIRYDEVRAIERRESGLFKVYVGNEWLSSRTLIMATGADQKKAGFSGEETFIGHGVSYCATCDGALYRGKHVYVVGGGTSACEEALFLSNIVDHVTIVVRGRLFKTFPSIVHELEHRKNVEILYNTVIEEVSGNRALNSIRLLNTTTGTTKAYEYDEGSVGVFVFVGHTPRTELVRGLVDIEQDGIVTDALMKTSTPGLFAAGDVRNTVLRQVITAASDGAIAATSAYQYLSAQKTI